MLRATILKSIDDEATLDERLARAAASERIAKQHEADANKRAADNEAWRQWGPVGIVAAGIIMFTAGFAIGKR